MHIFICILKKYINDIIIVSPRRSLYLVLFNRKLDFNLITLNLALITKINSLMNFNSLFQEYINISFREIKIIFYLW